MSQSNAEKEPKTNFHTTKLAAAAVAVDKIISTSSSLAVTSPIILNNNLLTSPQSPPPNHRLTLRDKYLRKTEYLLNVKGKEIAEALAKQQGIGPKTLQQQKEEQDLLERLQRTCKKLESRRDRVLSLTQQNTFTGGYVVPTIIDRKPLISSSSSSTAAALLKRTESPKRLSVNEKYLRKTEWLLNVKRQKIEVLKSLAKKQIKDPISDEKKQINHTQLLALERECIELERERVKQLREQTQKNLHRAKNEAWQTISKSNSRSRKSRSKSAGRSRRKSTRRISRSPKRRKSKSRHSRSPRRVRRKSRSPRRRHKSRSPRDKRLKSSRDKRNSRRLSRSPVLRFSSRSPVSRYSRSPTSRYSKSPRRCKSPSSWRRQVKSPQKRIRHTNSRSNNSPKSMRKVSRHRDSSCSSRDRSEDRSSLSKYNKSNRSMAPPPPTIKATTSVKPVHLYHQDDSDKSGDNMERHNESFSDASSSSSTSSSTSVYNIDNRSCPPTPPPPPTFNQSISLTPSPKRRSPKAFEIKNIENDLSSFQQNNSKIETISNTQVNNKNIIMEQKLNTNNGYGENSNKFTILSTHGKEKIENFHDDTKDFRNKSPPIVHTNWRPVKDDTGPLPTRIQLSGRAQLRFQLQRLHR